MKRLLLFSLLLLSAAIAFAQDFTVNKLHVDVKISPEGYFDVEEKYDVTFHAEKHGLLRDIRLRYDFIAEGAEKPVDRRIIISNVEVPGWKFKTNPSWKMKWDEMLNIKIGSANKLVTGNQQYIIRYRVENAFVFSDTTVQFYWNLKPSDWSTTFEQIDFTIHTPAGAALSKENCFVYSGNSGNANLSNEFDLTYSGNELKGRSVPGFYSRYGENVTVLIKMPADLIKEVDYSVPLWKKYSWLGILLLLWAGIRSLWKTKVKDEDKVTSITSYYPPRGVDSAIAGYLIDDTPDNRDLVSLIPYWATLGLLTIKDVPKSGVFGKADMELKKLKPLHAQATSYEKIIFDGLFEDGDVVLVSSFQDKFYTKMNKAKSQLKDATAQYYDKGVTKSRQSIGCLTILAGLGLAYAFLQFFGIIAAVSSAVLFLVLGFLFFKFKKNPVGNQAYAELLGFRQFIKLAEQDRIQSLLNEDPKYFDKTIAYAVSFNLLKEWTKKFEALNIAPPDWYSSPTGMGTMAGFSNSFSSSMSSAQSSLVSAPSSSSSGGGSSGGGFGGGGGGSW